VGAASLSQFLTLYNWFPLAFLLVFLLLIARFYQKSVAEKTYYFWFALPILLFGAAAMRYASIDQLTGDPWGDLLLGIGGVALLTLALFLYFRMTRNHGESR